MRVADQVDAIDPEFVQYLAHPGGEVGFPGQWSGLHTAACSTDRVQRINDSVPAQVLDDDVPLQTIGADCVQQDDRRLRAGPDLRTWVVPNDVGTSSCVDGTGQVPSSSR